MPLWPLLVAAGLVAVCIAVAVVARRTPADLFDAFRVLGCDRTAAVRLVGWIALATAGRLASATAVAAAWDRHRRRPPSSSSPPSTSPLPITPGNIGVTSATIAIGGFRLTAPHSLSGLAAGIAFHAIETAVGIMFGVASLEARA